MPHPKVKLSDDSGNEVGVTSNRLDVNAHLAATPTIDIGDVSLLLDGTAADYGTGNVNTSGRTLRVTIASDDVHFGAVGASAEAAGKIHQQLYYIGNQITLAKDELITMDTDIGYLVLNMDTMGTSHSTSDTGFKILTVRNDTLAALHDTDNDYSVFQVNSIGGLYVTGSEVENAAVQSEPLLIGGRYDSSARTLGDGDAGAVALNASGHLITTFAAADAHFGTVGEAAAQDTTIHGQLRYIAFQTQQAMSLLTTIDVDTNNISNYTAVVSLASYVDDADWTDGSSYHLLTGGIYQSTPQSITDGDTGPLQVDINGNLIISGSVHDASVLANGFGILAEAKSIDGSALPNSTAEGDAIRVAATRGGVLYSCLSSLNGQKTPVIDDDDGQVATPSMVNVGGEYRSGDTTYTNGDATILQTNINGLLRVDGSGVTQPVSGTVSVNSHAVTNAGTFAVQVSDTSFAVADGNALGEGVLVQGDDGSDRKNIHVDASTGDVQVDVTNTVTVDGSGVTQPVSLASVPSHAVTNAGTFAVQAGHDITGMVSGVNSAVSDSTAEQLDGSTDSSLDVACKRVDLMATQSNTGDIWVGDSGVTSNGAGGGMQLKPGDFYSIDVNNLNDIWVIATVDEEDIHFTYYT
jgi:hypothetical protein